MTTLAQRTAVNRQEVPAGIRMALYTLLIVAGALSVPALGKYGPLPTTTLLDAWVILFILATLFRGRIQTTGLILLLTGYLLTRVVPALATESPMEDFLQAYRWVLYLIAFAFAVGRKWGPVLPLVRVTWALMLMALVKAVLTFAVLGAGERPGLLLENNFELALFSGLVAVFYAHLGRGKFPALLTLGALTLLSGSRSGAIAFLIVALYAIFQVKTNLFFRYLMAMAIPALVLVPVWIFSERTQVGVTIDRLNFLDVFGYETRNWDVLDWIFGSTPITPLSGEGCSRLSFYQPLFSSVGDGTCYSVILHAFTMRVIFDAGILGLLIAFGVTWYTMRVRSRVPFLLAAALLLIAFTNSLSVSGLNNPYVALPILLAVLTVSSRPYSKETSSATLTGTRASSRNTV